LVPYVLKVPTRSIMFILDFNLVISVSFVTYDRFAYLDRHVDTWTRIQLKRWKHQNWRKGPTYANSGNIRDQIETFKI
jgi:hypothetical protein